MDLYGLPSYDEIDPTPFVALTYILLFGIMFGDLGQGLLVSVTGYLMWKLKRMPLGRILIPCGISSAVFGMVFGSVFGFEHWLDPMYQAMGFAEKPIEVMQPSTTNVIIYSAVGIGIFLMLAAILINIYSSVKRKHWENAFFGFNGVAGLIFYGGIVVGFGGQVVFGWQIVTPLYIVLVIALPLLASLFPGGSGRSGGKAGPTGNRKAGAVSLCRISLKFLNFFSAMPATPFPSCGWAPLFWCMLA